MRVRNLGFRVQGLGFRVQVLGFRVHDRGLGVGDGGLGVYGTRCRNRDRFMTEGLGFRVEG